MESRICEEQKDSHYIKNSEEHYVVSDNTIHAFIIISK